MSIELIPKQVHLNVPSFMQAKKHLKTAFPKKERLDQTADNYEQRLKRVSFYEKNGICRTGYGFSSEGVDYFVQASDTKNFDPSECKKLFGGISLIREPLKIAIFRGNSENATF